MCKLNTIKETKVLSDLIVSNPDETDQLKHTYNTFYLSKPLTGTDVSVNALSVGNVFDNPASFSAKQVLNINHIKIIR